MGPTCRNIREGLYGRHKWYLMGETCRNIREDYMGHIRGTGYVKLVEI